MFPLLSFDQANPVLTGYGKILQQQYQQMLNKRMGIQNDYLPQSLQASLTGQQIANDTAEAKLPYVGPQAQANVGLTDAQARNAAANAGLTGAQTNLLRQQTPYLVRDAEGKIYSDPILSRLFQITQAQNSGAIPNSTLANVGLVPSDNAAASPAQVGGVAPGSAGALSPTSAPKMFGGDPAQNWAMFGTPYNPIQYAQMMSAATTQGKTGVTTYNDALKAAADTAQDASDMNNYINQFNAAYDKSTYKGPRLGNAPSSGPWSALVPGDLTPEQQADSAAQNMQALVLKLMHTNRLTNYELQFASNLKLNRMMTPETVNNVGNFLTAKVGRLREQQDFLNAARDKGVDAQTASSLWQLYNEERPVYNFQTQKATGFKKSWDDYLKPEMVRAVQQGGLGQNAIPPLQNQYSKLQSAPGYTDADLQYTAQKYGMTPDQVRQKLGAQ